MLLKYNAYVQTHQLRSDKTRFSQPHSQPGRQVDEQDESCSGGGDVGVAARRCLVFSPRGSSGGAAGTHYYGSSTAQKAGQRCVGGGLQQPDSLTPPGVNISAIQQLNGNLSPRMCGAAAQGLGPGIGGDHTITTCHVTSKMCHVLCRIDSKSIFWETVLWRFFFPDDAKQNR